MLIYPHNDEGVADAALVFTVRYYSQKALAKMLADERIWHLLARRILALPDRDTILEEAWNRYGICPFVSFEHNTAPDRRPVHGAHCL